MNLKKIWWEIVKIKTPRHALEAVEFLLKPHFYHYFQYFNKPVFAIEISNPRLGFFANLNWCLYISHYCKEQGLTPYFKLTSRNYLNSSMGPDWFEYFFVNSGLSTAGYGADYLPRHVTKIRNLENIRLPRWACELSIERAADLFNENITVRPEILAYINEFTDKYFAGKQMLGVHFRGTDKITEAPRVDWGYIEKTIRNYLRAHVDVGGIFVASDESSFIQHITAKFPDITVISHEDHFRSDGSKAIHSLDFGGDNYLKGMDALVNSLLLSKCSALIRSSSFLSAWASIFNPSIPVVLLNKPHPNGLWFPEVEIIKQSQEQYLPDRI